MKRLLFLIFKVNFVSSVDLLNVSFDKNSPDRKTSIQSYKELLSLSPKRQYNLIFIDKTLKDIEEMELGLMKNIYPKMTHMDFNIATALKFASRGCGYLYGDLEQKEIKTGSKIILSGLGNFLNAYEL